MFNRNTGGRQRSSGSAVRRSNNGGTARYPKAMAGNRSGGRGGRKQPDYDVSLFVRKAIVTTEMEAFHPEHKFADFAIHPKLKENIAKKGYAHPTPIQDGAIPHVLEGRDVIGIASTGTGKTAAFLLPLITKVFGDRKKEFVLIMAPTRELALQIKEEFDIFAAGSGLLTALLIGGAHMDRQIADLRRGPNFIIGTPGRIKDLVEREYLNHSPCNNIVLDEVDRMLDMGFINDIRHILSLIQEKRQSLFFSATMEQEIRNLALKFLNDPITVTIKSRATSENVDQDVLYVSGPVHKLETLHELLLKPEFKKVLVFVQMKHAAEKLSKQLSLQGFEAVSIHGNLSQSQRQRALKAFRDDHAKVLVATDVAARGLDIDNITHVINYDLPMAYQDYIHRIGRTGRGGKKGTALTFIER